MKKLLLLLILLAGINQSTRATWSNRDRDSFFVLLDSVAIYTKAPNDSTRNKTTLDISARLLKRTRELMLKYHRENYYEWMRILQTYYYPNWDYTYRYYAYGHNTLFEQYMMFSTPAASTIFQHALVDVVSRKQWYLFNRPDIATKFNELPYSKSQGLAFSAMGMVIYSGWIPEANKVDNFVPIIADKLYKFSRLHPELINKGAYPQIGPNTNYQYIYWVRNPLYNLMSSLRLKDRSITPKAREAIGLQTLPYWEARLWDTFNVVMQHCGKIKDDGIAMNLYKYYDPQVRDARYNVLANGKPGAPYLTPYFAPYYTAPTTGGHNIHISPRGTNNNQQLNEIDPSNSYDVTTTVNIHEEAHQVWGQSLARDTTYYNRIRPLLDRLGNDPGANLKYIGFNFYTNTRQEIFASFSNNYVNNTRKCFKYALERFEAGIPYPLQQFLWMVTCYSQDRPFTVFYHVTNGPDAEIFWEYIPIERDAEGYITRIKLSNCEVYNFTYDDKHDLFSVSYPTPKQLLSEGSTCADLDVDNDGISNADEGYLGQLLDLGDFGALAATGSVNNVNKTIFVPQNNGDSINLRLQKNTTGNEVRLNPTGGNFESLDPSGDGSLINFLGSHIPGSYAQTRFYFGTPLNDVTFAIADLDKETGSGQEIIEILYKNGINDWEYLPQEYISNLTSGQAGPTVNQNLIYGANTNNSNVFKVQIPKPITELIIRVPALDNDSRIFNFNFSLFNLSWSKDFDKDGVSNNYDWDSDNDGCPDALEGTKFAQFSNLDYNMQVAGEEDNQGFPLFFNGSQGIGTSQNSTIKSDVCSHCASISELSSNVDGDNVMDACDLDNDNDGITDGVEQGSLMKIDWASLQNKLKLDIDTCVYWGCNGYGTSSLTVSSPNGSNVGVDFKLTNHEYGVYKYGQVSQSCRANDPFFSPLNPKGESGVYVVRNSLNAGTTASLSMKFSRKVGNVRFYVGGINKGLQDGSAEMLFVRAFSNGTEIPISNKNFLPVSGINPLYQENSMVGFHSTKDNIVEVVIRESIDSLVLTVRGENSMMTNADVAIYNIHFAADQDNDNIPNLYDLDSDSDGCPDAIEGSKSVTVQNVSSTGYIIGSVDANGVPTTVTGGQGLGTSLNAAAQDPDCVATPEAWADWYAANEDKIKIFPNPVDRGTTFRVKKTGIENIQIYSMMGSLVAERHYEDGPEIVEFPSSEFTPGAYYLIVNNSKEDRAYFIVR